jgi:hypothetical protein
VGRPKASAKKADWIAYADEIEASRGNVEKLDELEADARQYRKQIAQLKRSLRGK